jgi:hypothetical protein
MALPYPPTPALDDAVLAHLDSFVGTKRNERADLPGVTDQRRDYRQKITTLAESFASSRGHAMRIADLFGSAPDEFLRHRRDPRTGAPLRTASRNRLARPEGFEPPTC